MFSWHYQSGHPAPSLNTVEKGLAIFSKGPFARQQHNQLGYSALQLPALPPLVSARSYLARLFICFHFAKCAFPSAAACMPEQRKPNKQSLHALLCSCLSLSLCVSIYQLLPHTDAGVGLGGGWWGALQWLHSCLLLGESLHRGRLHSQSRRCRKLPGQ